VVLGFTYASYSFQPDKPSIDAATHATLLEYRCAHSSAVRQPPGATNRKGASAVPSDLFGAIA
jgi:hypothetical protein